jgi:hypothetical protein
MCAHIASRVPIYRLPRFVGLDMENRLAAVIRRHLDGDPVDNYGPDIDRPHDGL